MSDEETYADFATVRDLLLDAEGRCLLYTSPSPRDS